MGSIPHSRNSQIDAWNDGRHDGWIEAKRSHIPEYAEIPLTMGHFTREDLAILLRSGGCFYGVRLKLLLGDDQHHTQSQLLLNWHSAGRTARRFQSVYAQ